MRKTADWIAADADASRLAVTARSELPNRFVGQRSRTRDHTNLSLFVNVTGHDPDLACARSDDSRTVRSDQTRSFPAHLRFYTHHVHHRDSFGDANDEIDICVDGFED